MYRQFGKILQSNLMKNRSAVLEFTMKAKRKTLVRSPAGFRLKCDGEMTNAAGARTDAFGAGSTNWQWNVTWENNGRVTQQSK
jgi:hypothetical protein